MAKIGGRIKVGVIGCGNISDIYLSNCRKFDNIEVAACADLIPKRASEKAAKHGVPRACSVDELLADPEIRIVLNLTIPKAHAEIALRALEHGKCVHNEKPLATTMKDAAKIMALAKKKKLLVGCAPDTFMGAGLQTCRKVIDDGLIGEPHAAEAFMMCRGHESWHPDPEFYYKKGGGPMLDMGPYYLTALVSMLGPVKRVCGAARITFKERLITSKPKHGQKIKVETPTHIAGVMEFKSGAVGVIITSFDVAAHVLPNIQVHGSEGSMLVPDPNGFGGPVRVKRVEWNEWREIPLMHPYAENWRGVGVADMARALQGGHPHRASGALAYHVLEVMTSIIESEKGRYSNLKTTCARPAPMPLNNKERVFSVGG
jgi:predicted dehydrogenase